MLLRDIRVRGWRNLADEKLAFGHRVSVLFGQNGQGKSNLLEAAYYAITFRSFRTSSIGDLIEWGRVGAEIEAGITLRGLDRTISVCPRPRLQSGGALSTERFLPFIEPIFAKRWISIAP